MEIKFDLLMETKKILTIRKSCQMEHGHLSILNQMFDHALWDFFKIIKILMKPKFDLTL